MSPVLHVGIDAGNFPVLDGMAAQGLMPTYAELKKRSGHGVLRSTLPWFTVPGWVSLMTGIRAERHGMIHWTTARPGDHWRRERGSRLVSSADIPFPTLFEVASSAGRRVASINMPVTFPPIPVNGVMVSGFLGPTDPDRVAHPPGFLGAYPDYEVDVESGPGSEEDRVTERMVRGYADRLARMAGARARVGVDLMEEGYDLVSVVFVGPDRLLHVAWPAVAAALDGEREGMAGAVAEYYRGLDEALGVLLATAGDRLVLVTSDHGQGPPPPRLLSVGGWLRDAGWLVVRHQTAHRLARLAPSWAKRVLWRPLLRFRRRPIHAPAFVDWDRTVAYGIPFPHCNLFGVALREPSESLLAEVTDAATSITDPETGAPLVTRVLRGPDVASEHARESYPDLLFVLEPTWGTIGRVDDQPWLRANPYPESGAHESDGLLLAAGPGIDPGPRSGHDIWEIAPTVLAALGVEVPAAMDAGPIPWIVPEADRGAAAAPAPAVDREPSEGLSDQEEEEVARHLRELGYLE